ncbi:AraC family transcriptional regulator [Kribbella ginsengisoli]|uniref:AraC family transcriptional regulator n=1 Tax=Kribbella ginsengisoli TaxID=363865 RepID=A0ABP6XRN9_9ACTN
MADPDLLLAEIRDRISVHTTPDMRTPIDGLLLARMESSDPEYSLTEPLLVVMAQGAKQLLLGDKVYEYRAGDVLIVTADLPVTGHFIEASPDQPSLGLGLVLRPATIAPLLLESARPGTTSSGPAMATGPASPELLDAAARLLRLLDSPADIPVLAPMIEREILWRLLTGPYADVIRQIGLADSSLTHISRAIRWIRDNYAEPMRIADLASLAGMSPAAFHRHFRAITALSPLQFQKRIRLQEARSLLASHPSDIAGIGHLVGYDSPSQFNREYRRLFGTPPGQDAARLRTTTPHLP